MMTLVVEVGVLSAHARCVWNFDGSFGLMKKNKMPVTCLTAGVIINEKQGNVPMRESSLQITNYQRNLVSLSWKSKRKRDFLM